MANRYWVGGTGTWDSTSTTHWSATSGGASGASSPTSADNAIFDNNSGAAGMTVTTSGTSCPALNVDMSARTNGMTLAVSSQIDCYGSWINGSGTTLNTGGLVQFTGTGAVTLTSAGKSFPQYIYVNKTSSGSVSLVDDFVGTYGSAYALRIKNGTFNLNGKNATIHSVILENTSGVVLGVSVGTLTLNGAGFIFNMSASGSCTGTGVISCTSSSAKTFAGNGKTYPVLENAGAGAMTITGSNTFTTIRNSVQPTTLTFTSGTTQTVTNFSVSGTAGNMVTINASSTTAATLSKASGTVDVSYCAISYSTATGGATWKALTTNGNTNGGNNSGWNFGNTGNGLFFGSNF